jgi:hypothetical protein
LEEQGSRFAHRQAFREPVEQQSIEFAQIALRTLPVLVGGVHPNPEPQPLTMLIQASSSSVRLQRRWRLVTECGELQHLSKEQLIELTL